MAANFLNTPDTTAQFDPQDVELNNRLSLLSYLGILVLIPIFLVKRSRFAKYHANQGLALLIMNVGKIFNSDFGLFYNVPQNSGSLYPVTQVIDTYVYRAYANTHNMGMSSAAGLLQNVVGFICIVITNAIVRKLDPESTLF